MTAQQKYPVTRHAPSDLGSERAVALFEFREPHERNPALYGDWPDTKILGLYLHIGRNSASWRFRQNVQKRGKRVVHYQTLGSLSEMDFKNARKEAKIFAGQVAADKAPSGKRAARKFGEAFEAYMAKLKEKAEAKGKPPRWHANVQKIYRDYLKPQWENWTLVEMSNDPRTVAAWYTKLARRVPTTAAHCVRLIRACYQAELRFDRSLPQALPTSGVKLGAIVLQTEKAMEADGFPAWRAAWDKIDNQTLRGYHLCGLLTGCRPGELAMVRKGDFDPKAHTLTLRNIKSKGEEVKDLTIPTTPQIEYAIKLALNAPVQTIVLTGLKGMQPGQKRVVKRPRHGEVLIPDLIFPGCRQAPARSKLPTAGHALRHTYKSLATALRVPDVLSSILLGHAIPGISGRYIGELAVLRSAELRAEQEKISKHMFKLLGLSLPKGRQAAA
jgi:integrase